MRIIHEALHNQDLQAEIPSPVTRSMRDIRGEAALSRQAGNHLSPGARHSWRRRSPWRSWNRRLGLEEVVAGSESFNKQETYSELS